MGTGPSPCSGAFNCLQGRGSLSTFFWDPAKKHCIPRHFLRCLPRTQRSRVQCEKEIGLFKRSWPSREKGGRGPFPWDFIPTFSLPGKQALMIQFPRVPLSTHAVRPPPPEPPLPGEGGWRALAARGSRGSWGPPDLRPPRPGSGSTAARRTQAAGQQERSRCRGPKHSHTVCCLKTCPQKRINGFAVKTIDLQKHTHP